jgi:hypothetical protein
MVVGKWKEKIRNEGVNGRTPGGDREVELGDCRLDPRVSVQLRWGGC